MIEIFHYEFVRNAIISLLIASLISGIVGSYIVSKRIVLITGGIAHSAFGGVGLGIFLGINPFMSAIPFSILSAILIGLIGMKSKRDEDVAIALLWTLGMSLGILFLNLSSGYVTDVLSYLFGSLITVSSHETLIMGFTALLVLIISFLFHKEFESISFDEEFAFLSGISVRFFNLLLLSLVALSVVILMKSIGILLMIAILSVPPSIARRLTYDLKEMMMLSFLIALNISLFGFLISYFLSVSPSVIIVLILSISFLLLHFWENFL
jgi:zinc transport system permease protein